MKFNLSKKISLDFVGEGWQDCFIRFNAVTFNEAKELQPKLEIIAKDNNQSADFLLSFLQEKFLSGKGLSEHNDLIDITKEDIGEFPIGVLIKSASELLGEPEKKA